MPGNKTQPPVTGCVGPVYYDSLYFCSNGRDADWFAKVYRDSQSGDWRMRFRVRSYHDPEPFSEHDTKDWYQVTTKSGDEKTRLLLRGAMLESFSGMCRHFGRPVEVVELQCFDDDPKFFFALASRDWVHLKLIK